MIAQLPSSFKSQTPAPASRCYRLFLAAATVPCCNAPNEHHGGVTLDRKLFCQLSPAAYRLAVQKNILKRRAQDALAHTPFALTRSPVPLEHRVYAARSLIRRTLTRFSSAPTVHISAGNCVPQPRCPMPFISARRTSALSARRTARSTAAVPSCAGASTGARAGSSPRTSCRSITPA